jgi:hypothetical protein
MVGDMVKSDKVSEFEAYLEERSREQVRKF